MAIAMQARTGVVKDFIYGFDATPLDCWSQALEDNMKMKKSQPSAKNLKTCHSEAPVLGRS
jgi:hypothetical protein